MRCEDCSWFEWVGKSTGVKSEEDVVLTLKDFVVEQTIVSDYMLLQYNELDDLYCITTYQIISYCVYHIVHIL